MKNKKTMMIKRHKHKIKVSIKAALLTIVAMIFMSYYSYSQTTETFTATTTWTCPDGVNSIAVKVWGAGGGGGYGGGTNKQGGGGGAGGGYSYNATVSVSPGTTYNLTIGTGGAGGISTSTNGGSAIPSSATFGATTVSANGGGGGLVGPKGAGGSTGTGTTYNGGNGATAPNNDAGGGGEGACTTGNGNSATNATGASGCDGGNGGNGATANNGAGSPGLSYGGGGGGGTNSSNGASGADGYIEITYTCPSGNSPAAGSDQSLTACATSTSLAGNTPDYGTGTWTLQSGTGTITSPNSPTSTVTGLVVGTSATFRWSFANGACTTTPDDVIITANTGAGCWSYCSSTHTVGTTYYLSNVTFNTINNNSTNACTNMYCDNTATSTDLIRGSSYDISVTAYNGANTANIYVFFDWNNDGTFNNDATERYFVGLSAVTGPTSLGPVSISVPATATMGTTRMRVVMQRSDETTNPCDPYTSGYGETEDYTVNIIGAPTITTQPTNQTMCYNSSADFEVEVAGISPFTYQWKYNGSNVVDGTPAGAIYNGANTSILSVNGTLATGPHTPYKCYITNIYGNVTSDEVDLTVSVDVAPNVPTDLTKSDDFICDGTAVTLGATVDAGDVLQWYSGTCSGTSETSPVSPSSSTTYFARAFDSGTGCYSACESTTISVLDEVNITLDPVDQIGCVGTSVTFEANATGAGLTYQWRKGGVDISGETSSTYTIASIIAGDAGNYDCVITGTCDNATSTAATLSILTAGLSGTKTVGSGGDYTTLKAAFDAINTNGLSGDLELQVISDITETAEASLSEWTDCAGNSGYSVIIYPTGSTRTISGSIATSLVTFSGADNVTIEGRLDKTGAANSLVFSNSNTSGATLTFVNDACNNTVAYSTLQGASSGSTGVIFFSTATSTGNDDNLISECDIKDDASTPLYGIYSLGTIGSENNNNTISGCNIYNFWKSASITRGIYLSDGNTKWTITGNSLYQTSARADAAFYGISISDTNGGEYTITGNYIGGTASECGGGSNMSYNGGTYGVSFEGIILYTSSSGISLLKDNVIKNIDFTSAPVTPDGSQDVIWTGIDIWSGRVDVIDNIIGDESTGSINVTVNEDLNANGGTAWNNGIWHGGEGNVIGNKIGSITFSGTISTQCGFNAIEYVGTTITDQILADNVVGNATTANSISFASSATPAMTMGGIYFGTAGNFKTTVANNIVANINNGCTATNSFLVALNNQATDGSQIIMGNSIHDITTASAELGYYSTSSDFPAFAGIRTNNTAAGNTLTISNNSIYSISSTNATASITLFGIYCATGTTGTHNINANSIHSFSTANTSSLVTQKGLVLSSGIGTISNNTVRLGITGVNSDNLLTGIEISTVSNNSIYFNSVFVGGTATSAQNSTSFYRNAAGASDIRNNIFVNARTGGTGTHYAYFLSNTTSLTSDYNLYSDNAGGVNANATGLRTTLAGIQTGTAQDANSLVANPQFIAPLGAGTAVDLHIGGASPAIGVGIAGTGITTDCDDQERLSGVNPNGPCMGADENISTTLGTDVYGIYSPDGINGSILDCEIITQGGAPGGTGYNVADPSDAYWPNVDISTYQVVTSSNISCTGVEFTYTTDDASPNWIFGNGSSPASGSTSPITTEYSSTGIKDLIESVIVFSDFNNLTMPAPDPGTILGAPSGAGCPTTYTYTSSVAGSAGFLYDWECIPPSGCSIIINDASAESTDITFENPTGVNQIFELVLTIETECCGLLRPVTRYLTIFPGPDQPTISGSPYSICTGGDQTIPIDSPDAAYSYQWFNASTGGTQIGSGTSYSTGSEPSGTNYYYAQSTNSYGCSSNRTEIEVTGTDTPAPTVNGASTCGDNDVTLSISAPQAGYTYEWISGSCAGTVLQSSTSSAFTYNITSTTTFYVSSIPSGCAASTCATSTVTYVVPPNPINWLGTVGGNNNWFNTTNWTSGCLPNCGTNVNIPVTANDPDIGFDVSQVAATQDINLQSGVTLSFSDSKAKLEICGDFTHAGDITTNDFGEIAFTGSTAQTYFRGGIGDLNNVVLNNTAAPPTLSVTSRDLEIGTSGSLTFQSGIIITSANKVIIKNPASSSISGYGSDRYISGSLRRYINAGTYDYAFPIGIATRYTLAELSNTGLTGISYIDAEFVTSFTNTGSINTTNAVDFGTPYTSISTEGVWQLDPDAAATGGSYSIKLWFDDGGAGNSFAGLVDNYFGVLKRPSASTLASDWTAQGGTLNTPATANGRIVSGGYTQRTGWSTFSQYAVAKSTNPLPIELLSFYAYFNGDNVDLYWVTETELNNDYFILEKSDNLSVFEEIAFVESKSDNGNSNQKLYYSHTDNDVISGTYYYRLKQFDIDGSFMFSNIVTVIIGPSGTFTIQPNPATDFIKVNYFCMSEDTPIINIYDDRGRLVTSKEVHCTKGQNYTEINISDYAPGMYIVCLITTESVQRAKLIKK